MTRWIPSLPQSLSVLLLWLLLVADLTWGQLLLGLGLAIGLPLLSGRLMPQRARFGRHGVLLRLALRVAGDIVLSNIEVARRILGPERALTPGFVWVPLELTNIHGITALASIITLTPGTVSAELSEDQRHLLVHCFNLKDAAATVADIKHRYEAPLKEIFP
ncbi:cation:proton antiporter [Lysobacter daejeonensis GH1-9]|uniref:Cation:proton antiporter n=1 Tax=Lysobacter daejeonensis GH1-9 TaxID=1385517 RepID=A0A0A0EYD1_9GAMM|nr:Na+/H+ antiporter subunit E [Lysobacter daejeonensis]KGM55083.1 cation:proton antiporter [Lysobacter daejeonensis GH1-9]